MNKLIFTGPTCYLGEWHFTSLKVYDMHLYKNPGRYREILEIFYIVADNNKDYYMRFDQINQNFITIEKWREIQVDKILSSI